MGVMREWACLEHGEFEGTHPICPFMGCRSEAVTRVFLTPPSISKGKYKRFEAGLRKSSEMYGISNFKTARNGETAFEGRATTESKDLGMEVLWGTDVEKKMGKSFAQLSTLAHQPLVVGDKVNTRNNALAELATEAGLTSRAIPRAGEVIGSKAEKSEAKARTLT